METDNRPLGTEADYDLALTEIEPSLSANPIPAHRKPNGSIGSR
jgi:hypothetical protein